MIIPNTPLLISAHSMEEAEVLCDRIGIFVDGGLQCIGGPKQVTFTSRIPFGTPPGVV